MKKNFQSKFIFIFIFSLFLVFCKEKQQQFTISGKISGGTDKTLYLENVGISKIIVIDSLHLKSDEFTFKHERPATPDFYRLRLGNQIINIPVDSTENIRVTANAADFATEYLLSGDDREAQKIKQLTLLQIETSQKYNALQTQLTDGILSVDQYMSEAQLIIENYKNIAKGYILDNFLSPSAYFALFQQVNNLLIFDIQDKDDNKLFGAVANVWNQTYPQSQRAIQLKTLYANARAFMRSETVEIKEGDMKTLYDISLPSLKNNDVRLSEIGEGKITLIDFISYTTINARTHNIQLAEIYEKYKSKGFEIYQISLDIDIHLWKNAVVNLPWICVRDPQSIYSSITRKYNVLDLPTGFIRDGKGDIISRIDDYGGLKDLIARYFE
jgi:hypothetical protein